ncbi:flavin reductase family protein [Guyparkeria hydrothermalis]|uniref:flavin reductase family protein n=1 Tax=Guyparkeria hydrothermalis TaxID=923 RepID=UPI0020213BEB|nr:flavin reductase family protein [Guyparkeria hydrothermalis]MCL7744578.1 flavin reductase family protein [Guyparkeria hydrothermalis]
MEKSRKADFPVERVRHYLEPGPVVLVSSACDGERDIMTLGWHTVMEFSPSLVGCLISAGNHSFELVRRSGECVINLPTAAMVDTVIGIGNTHGDAIDKFDHFGLTAESSDRVAAPAIAECHAQFECRLVDDRLVTDRNFFVFEVIRARVAPEPAWPETLHYTGDGVFMISGRHIDRRQQFRPGML